MIKENKTFFIFLSILLILIVEPFCENSVLSLYKKINNPGFEYPVASASTDKYIFVLDMDTGYIFRFDHSGNFQMKFGGEIHFKMPVDIETDGFNNIYILDSHLNCIKRFDENGVYKGISAQRFYHPSDLFRDDQGRFTVADYGNKKIKIYDQYFNLLESIDARDVIGRSFNPTAASVKNNKVYVSDWNTDQIIIYNMKGSILNSFGSTGRSKEQFYKVEGICFDTENRIYFLDWGNSAIKIFDENLSILEIWGKPGIDDNSLKYPSDMKIYRNTMFITDSLNKEIKIFKIELKKSPFIKVKEIKVPDFPITDIYFEHNIVDFDIDSLEVFIGSKQLEIKEKDNSNNRIRVNYPAELLNREVDFYGNYNYNETLNIRFEKRVRLENVE